MGPMVVSDTPTLHTPPTLLPSHHTPPVTPPPGTLPDMPAHTPPTATTVFSSARLRPNLRVSSTAPIHLRLWLICLPIRLQLRLSPPIHLRHCRPIQVRQHLQQLPILIRIFLNIQDAII